VIDLSYHLLDDLCLAVQRSKLRKVNEVFKVTSVGVAIELLLFNSVNNVQSIRDTLTIDFSGLTKLVDLVDSPYSLWISPFSQDVGFVRTSQNGKMLEDQWMQFGVAAQKCAISCGIHRVAAARLVGALGELRSNIFEHSERSDSGIIAFQAHNDGMEFVVADLGVGLLTSLRHNAEFAHLKDHGAALRTALTDGVSRSGEPGRGLGFRAVFLGLANAVGELRFRTGDHVLTTSGESPSLIAGTLLQRAHFGGLLVQIRWRSSRIAMHQT
jgi:anti-sigma regulatory factor (Ser/Thr protein kinase)